MTERDHNTPEGQYNVFDIYAEDPEEIEEKFTVEITDSGVYLDHNFVEGCLYISHENFQKLNKFRQEFVEEISVE